MPQSVPEPLRLLRTYQATWNSWPLVPSVIAPTNPGTCLSQPCQVPELPPKALGSVPEPRLLLIRGSYPGVEKQTWAFLPSDVSMLQPGLIRTHDLWTNLACKETSAFCFYHLASRQAEEKMHTVDLFNGALNLPSHYPELTQGSGFRTCLIWPNTNKHRNKALLNMSIPQGQLEWP